MTSDRVICPVLFLTWGLHGEALDKEWAQPRFVTPLSWGAPLSARKDNLMWLNAWPLSNSVAWPSDMALAFVTVIWRFVNAGIADSIIIELTRD